MQNAQISNTVFASVAAGKPGIVPFAPGRSSAGQPHQGVARTAPPGRFADFLLRQPGVSNAPGTRTPEQPPPEIPALPPGSAALQQENSENAIAGPEPGYNLAAAVPDHHASAIAAATDTRPVLSGNPAETRPGRVPHAASLALITGTPGENFEAAPARNAASQTSDLPRPVAAAAARPGDPRDYAPPAAPLAGHTALAAAANKSDTAIADFRGNTSAMKSTVLPADGLSTPAIRLPETRQYPHHHRQTEAHGGHHPDRRADIDPAVTGVPPQARGPARRPGMPANDLPFHPATNPASLPPDSRPFPTSDAALSGSNKQAPS